MLFRSDAFDLSKRLDRRVNCLARLVPKSASLATLCYIAGLLSFIGPFAECLAQTTADSSNALVNFETAPVHPIALSPDGNRLAVCNLADGKLELFDLSSGNPAAAGMVPVGIDPVTVRFRNNDEAWVVNQISDSISVVLIPIPNCDRINPNRNHPRWDDISGRNIEQFQLTVGKVADGEPVAIGTDHDRMDRGCFKIHKRVARISRDLSEALRL
jgi:hypothetical protein